jgi:hypothetical protein
VSTDHEKKTTSHEVTESSAPESPAPSGGCGAADCRVRVEPNGREFLVIINGSAFVALSRSAAHAIARRTRGGCAFHKFLANSDE